MRTRDDDVYSEHDENASRARLTTTSLAIAFASHAFSAPGIFIYTAQYHALGVTSLLQEGYRVEYRTQTSKLPGTLAGDGEPQPNLILGQGFMDQTSGANNNVENTQKDWRPMVTQITPSLSLLPPWIRLNLEPIKRSFPRRGISILR